MHHKQWEVQFRKRLLLGINVRRVHFILPSIHLYQVLGKPKEATEQKQNMNSHISKSQWNASLPPAPWWAADQGGNILNFYFIRRPFLLRSGGPAPRPGQGRVSSPELATGNTRHRHRLLGANTATPGVKMKPAQELCALCSVHSVDCVKGPWQPWPGASNFCNHTSPGTHYIGEHSGCPQVSGSMTSGKGSRCQEPW